MQFNYNGSFGEQEQKQSKELSFGEKASAFKQVEPEKEEKIENFYDSPKQSLVNLENIEEGPFFQDLT
jgi:hypothetical protein